MEIGASHYETFLCVLELNKSECVIQFFRWSTAETWKLRLVKVLWFASMGCTSAKRFRVDPYVYEKRQCFAANNHVFSRIPGGFLKAQLAQTWTISQSMKTDQNWMSSVLTATCTQRLTLTAWLSVQFCTPVQRHEVGERWRDSGRRCAWEHSLCGQSPPDQSTGRLHGKTHRQMRKAVSRRTKKGEEISQ